MAFIESLGHLDAPRFPHCPSYGYTSTPRYSVSITTLAGGQERRNGNWLRPLVAIDGQIGPRAQAESQAALEWYHAVGGSEFSFRFQDRSDYLSCRVGEEPTPVDQPLQFVETGSGDGGYRLFKIYQAGLLERSRLITCPVVDAIQIANADGDVQADWDFDPLTRLIMPGPGFVGVPTTWGGEFDVPVRFEGEFGLSIVDFEIQAAPLLLREVPL